jgi:hypothetical protein
MLTEQEFDAIRSAKDYAAYKETARPDEQQARAAMIMVTVAALGLAAFIIAKVTAADEATAPVAPAPVPQAQIAPSSPPAGLPR